LGSLSNLELIYCGKTIVARFSFDFVEYE